MDSLQATLKEIENNVDAMFYVTTILIGLTAIMFTWFLYELNKKE